MDIYGPLPILMNVDCLNINTKAHVTNASDQVGRTYIGREEVKYDELDTTLSSNSAQPTTAAKLIWQLTGWTYKAVSFR